MSRRCPMAALAVATIALLAVDSASAQKRRQRAKLDPTSVSSYFDAMPVHQDDAPVRELLERAERECRTIEEVCPPGEQLLRVLFRGSYRDDLPDFVVPIRRLDDGLLHAGQPLLLFDRRNTPYLLGVEHLWVLVVSDEPVEMTAQLTTIREREVNPFAGMIDLFGVAAGPAAPTSETEAKEKPLAWRRLAGREDEHPLYIGAARLPIATDIVSRVTLIPADTSQLDFQSITGHLSNSRSSAAAFSIGLGATFGVDDTALGLTGGDPSFNAYALAKFYFPKSTPRLDVAPARRSRYRRSIGVVFGTNVTDDPFGEIVLGLSIGHLIGKAGLLVAANAIEGLDGGDREIRTLIGVDFTF